MAADPEAPKQPKQPEEPVSTDLALLHGPTEDGQGARVLRLKDGELSAGEVRPVKQGQPLTGQEVVQLNPVEGRPALCHVKTLHEGSRPASSAKRSAGPARVSNPDYRKNYDEIFGSRQARRADYSLN